MIELRVIEILSGLDFSVEVKLDTSLDSLLPNRADKIEALIMLEDEFELQIDLNWFKNLENVASIVTYIEDTSTVSLK